jgi:hypothetical protein
MPTFMELGEPTPSRLAAALAFIVEGRAVGFGGYSLAVIDGVLRVDVNYQFQEARDDLAIGAIGEALRDVQSLLERDASYKGALAGLFRRMSLVRSCGTSDVEIAEFTNDQLIWHRRQ